MIKRYIITVMAIVFMVFASVAQPISGFMGKRFATSLELEIVPGFQGYYEKNTSEFLFFFGEFMDNPYSYVPRFMLSTEYQIQSKRSIRGAIGTASMNVPLFLRPESNNLFNTHTLNIQQLQTTFIQIGFRSCNGDKQMPIASTYFGLGLGVYFISMDAFEAKVKVYNSPPELRQFDKTSAVNLAMNLEFGRRIVFNKGFFMDFGAVVNLSPSLLINFREVNDFFEEPLTFEDSIKGRVATNSLFNFKIAFGLFY